MSFSTKTAEFTPDQLLAGNFPIITDGVTLLTGTAYPRGAAVGIITASGKYQLSVHNATDGSQKIAGIVMDPVDATSGDKVGVIALAGDFNNKALTFGGASTVADFIPGLVRETIFIHKAAAITQP